MSRRGESRLLGIASRLALLLAGFTFGIGVEDDETFPAVLDERLDDEVLNGGVSAMGVPHEVHWLERHGLAVEPDAVVVATFIGNDFQDAMSVWAHRQVVNGRLYQKKDRSALKEWLFLHSELYVLLKESVPTPVQGWVRARLGLGEPWSVRRLRSSFAFFAQELSVTEAFRRGVERGEELYDPMDRHWTPLGHELAASRVADFLGRLAFRCREAGSSEAS